MNMMRPQRPTPRQTGRRIVIAAGGTGGHFFPAEALATTLLERGQTIALLTDSRSSGPTSAVFANHPVHVLPGAGIAGRSAAQAAQATVSLGAGVWQARALLRSLHPAAIVGFGGYPTVAPVLGSQMLRRRVPVILHEQNAVLGRTNRALAKRAAALALSFAQTARVPDGARPVFTGNPVRIAIAALSASPYAAPGEGPVRLLILGGSLGAHVLSDVVPRAIAALPDSLRARLAVTQQCRAEDLDDVRVAYAAAGVDATLASFFTDVASLLRDAHLVISRAGASTVAELAVIGRPAILVPLPSAIDDHQAANAASLGASVWPIRQEAFTAQALTALLTRLIEDQTQLTQAAAAILQHGNARAAAALADLVTSTIAAAAP
jgi:UDP-N-acetylglucosamine--N-acetylmuramyl-(pentapeptide) pyrophosphoryl-undecaprenol N-acetylglucosamine transferase